MVIDYDDPKPRLLSGEELEKERRGQTIWLVFLLVAYHLVHEIVVPLVAGGRLSFFFILIPLIGYFSIYNKRRIVIFLSIFHLIGLCLSARTLLIDGPSWSDISKFILLISDTVFLLLIIKIPLLASLSFLAFIFIFPASQFTHHEKNSSTVESNTFRAQNVDGRISALKSGLFCSERGVILYNPGPGAIFVRRLVAKAQTWQFQGISKLLQSQELNLLRPGFYQFRVHSGKFSGLMFVSIGGCVKEVKLPSAYRSNNLLRR
jgi:hypothetical protein